MRTILQAACKANGRSRACTTCVYQMKGNETVCRICSKAFVEGFQKGYKYYTKNEKKSKTRLKRERMMRQMDADMEEFFNYNDRGHEQDKTT